MPRKISFTSESALKVALIISAISALAAPRGFDAPRRLLSPLIAPLSRSGTYICDSVRTNIKDLGSENTTPETLRQILNSNPQLKAMLIEELDQQRNARTEAYEQWLEYYKELVADLSGARSALGNDFACMLIPARVIGSSASYFDSADKLIHADEKTPAGAMVTTCELLTGRSTALPEKLAVLVGSQLVGRIKNSSGWTGRLQLLIDPDFRIQGAVARVVNPENPRIITTNEPDSSTGKTVPTKRPLQINDPMIYVNLSGNGSDLVSAEVPALHEIRAGDKVFTLGDDPFLPMGVEIGTVTKSVESPTNPRHVTLVIEPSVDIKKIRDVLVVAPLASAGGK